MSFSECEAYYRRARGTREHIRNMAELRRVEALADGAGKSAVDGPGDTRELTRQVAGCGAEVALLTGGADTPYAFGLALALMSRGIGLDIIAGDELDRPQFHGTAGVSFLNLRGNQATDASLSTKVSRVLIYYGRLIRYGSIARPRLFHILEQQGRDLRSNASDALLQDVGRRLSSRPTINRGGGFERHRAQ